MNRILPFLTALSLLLAAPVLAQTYPDPETPTVNDFAGLLPPEAETAISAELDQLRADTGIAMTVVTLSRKAMFAPDQTLEQFAAGLFDQWGIGDKDRNDGILFLVLHSDRETRIELGKGFDNNWNREARQVLDDSVLPKFREDRYEAGIRAGTTDIIQRIALPYHAGAEPPEGSGVSGWWAALIFVPIGLVMSLGFLKDKIAAMRKCPQCGARQLSISRQILQSASKTSAGHGEKTTTCGNCDYRNVESYTIARRRSSSSSSSGFGGGSSGGGGASGRW